MAEETGIGWTDHTFNPWWGCNKKTAECAQCYIPRFIRGRTDPFKGPVLLGYGAWKAARAWNRKAHEAGRRSRVFTCSLSDFFEPEADQWRPAVWQLIRECADLDWLVLTKNAARIADHLPADWSDGYPNVWLGVTVGIESSMWRVPYLLDVPAKVRFISAEPLLGPLDFRPYLSSIDWVITGCESGAKDKRRPMQLDWVREIDKQCREFNVAHFFKQRYDDEGNLIKDGVLDGECRQAWPVARH